MITMQFLLGVYEYGYSLFGTSGIKSGLLFINDSYTAGLRAFVDMLAGRLRPCEENELIAPVKWMSAIIESCEKSCTVKI